MTETLDSLLAADAAVDSQMPPSSRTCLPTPGRDSHPFIDSLQNSFPKLTTDQRKPTQFELKTAEALLTAYRQTTSSDSDGFRVVSAPTGSGKTLTALALMTHLYPRPSAFVTRTVEEAHKVYESLLKLVPSKDVAVFTSLHKVGAERALIEEKRLLGITVGRRFTEKEFKKAKVVVCTHERWKREFERNSDLGVRKCAGVNRDIVIVDEDPESERVFVRQPEHVDSLVSLLSDTPLRKEDRSAGLSTTHEARDELCAVHTAMRTIKDHNNRPVLSSGEGLVSKLCARLIDGLTYGELCQRASRVAATPEEATRIAEDAWCTVEFLKAAASGMCFYARGADGAGGFYGYALAVPPEKRTIVLDGTAELNGLYSLCRHVAIVEGQRPDYSRVDLFYVVPPTEFEGRLKPEGIYANQWNAKPFVAWLREFLIANTSPGERILVYAKKDLLNYGLHKELDDGIESPFATRIEGRDVHFCNFGRGRGSNQWRDFDVYVRVGDFHQPKAVIVSKVGSVKGRKYGTGDYTRMSSGSTTHPDYVLARDTHLVVTNKQDAARIRIRNFDDDGIAPHARLYFVDTDLRLLQENQQAMFPGSSALRFIRCEDLKTPEQEARRGDKALKLRDALLSTDSYVLTGEEVETLCGISSKSIRKGLEHRKVSPVIAARGWTKTTKKSVGMAGKGYVLTRPAQAPSVQLTA